jgi:osmotically-inducible protein OsmY
MKNYWHILMVGTLAACASNNNPPAASSADVAAATTTPSTTTNDTASAPLIDDSRPATDASSTEKVANGSTGSNSAASNSAPPSSRSDVAPTSVQDNPSKAADNSGVNTRDNKERTVTPTDQGSSERDRKITQQIRQAVVKNGSLSFTAKNVKIITIDGKVTLRGPVNSDAERTTIEAAAKNVAGVAAVDNQLEIKK